MSFIAKNPLIAPIAQNNPPIPIDGTRGLFPQKDGWYDINSDGECNKIANLNIIKELAGAKANKGELVGVDIKTVTDSGIYSIGSDCTGLPEDLPAYYCGATLIVDNIPTDTEYTSANQYLIVNDYVDENGDYTYKSRIYACMLYGGSYDLPWQLVCDGTWGDNLSSLTESVTSLEEKVGDGFEEITDEQIEALFQ